MAHVIITVGEVMMIIGAVATSYVLVYRRGVEHGRHKQNNENREELEAAAIKVATAEQQAEVWARRARALLLLHGSARK